MLRDNKNDVTSLGQSRRVQAISFIRCSALMTSQELMHSLQLNSILQSPITELLNKLVGWGSIRMIKAHNRTKALVGRLPRHAEDRF
ncbi:hypothetical protein CEXT_620591 [Caerostris extrusa]|uniref:Uncharacterized protein n=1 Tax=Caerostris extrusa TaxID=172846 RepID=A0AAV4QCK0_CAEEX|nr:hypothetical protein CEXT_620591 [Caerostris extrusa]